MVKWRFADAVHPTMPILGQVGSQATEDGYHSSLKDTQEVEDALNILQQVYCALYSDPDHGAARKRPSGRLWHDDHSTGKNLLLVHDAIVHAILSEVVVHF